MKITDHFRGIYRIYPNLTKENRRMSTWNRLDMQTLGSQPVVPKKFSITARKATIWNICKRTESYDVRHVRAVYKRHQLLGIVVIKHVRKIETHLCGNQAFHESSGRQSTNVATDNFEAQGFHRLDEEAMEVGSTPAAHHLHNQLLPLPNVASIDVQSFDTRCCCWFGIYVASIMINIARAWQILLSCWCWCCCCCFVELMMIHHHRLNNAFEGGRRHGWGYLGSADLLHRLLLMNHHGGCGDIIKPTSRIHLQVMSNWSTR